MSQFNASAACPVLFLHSVCISGNTIQRGTSWHLFCANMLPIVGGLELNLKVLSNPSHSMILINSFYHCTHTKRNPQQIAAVHVCLCARDSLPTRRKMCVGRGSQPSEGWSQLKLLQQKEKCSRQWGSYTSGLYLIKYVSISPGWALIWRGWDKKSLPAVRFYWLFFQEIKDADALTIRVSGLRKKEEI